MFLWDVLKLLAQESARSGEATRSLWPYFLLLAFNETLVARSYITAYRSKIPSTHDEFPMLGSVAEQVEYLGNGFRQCMTSRLERGESNDTTSEGRHLLRNDKEAFALYLAIPEPRTLCFFSSRGTIFAFGCAHLSVRFILVGVACLQDLLRPWKVTLGWPVVVECFLFILWYFMLQRCISTARFLALHWKMNQLARNIREEFLGAHADDEKMCEKRLDRVAELIESLLKEAEEDDRAVEERTLFVRRLIKAREICSRTEWEE
ncbi:hypothetical protein BDZ45DRAFT_684151 [Acephala macrosclerotiorum]|nr:hypothetical protein BDZ45DRAFT_684151 [Acephala macrosclerotiorum]